MRHDGHTDARKALAVQPPHSPDAPRFTVIIRFPLEYMAKRALDLYTFHSPWKFNASDNVNDPAMLQIWDRDGCESDDLSVYLTGVFDDLDPKGQYLTYNFLIDLAELSSPPLLGQDILTPFVKPAAGENVGSIVNISKLSQILTGHKPEFPDLKKRYAVAVLYDSLPEEQPALQDLTQKQLGNG